MRNEVSLVTGLYRSGTSMLMRCLEAGGMPVEYDHHQDELNWIFKTPDYVGNPNGYYGLDEDYARADFAERHAGRVLKCPAQDLEGLAPGQYRFVFITRNPKEIDASMRTFIPDGEWCFHRPQLARYDEYVTETVAMLNARGSVTVLHYANILKNPVAELQKLRDAGWDFDVEKGAAMVDPALYRFRFE
jgi:hypothetical protein